MYMLKLYYGIMNNCKIIEYNYLMARSNDDIDNVMPILCQEWMQSICICICTRILYITIYKQQYIIFKDLDKAR